MHNIPSDPVIGRADNGAALLAAAFYNNTQAATLTRLEDGLLVEANDAWLSLSGYSRADIAGKTIWELGLWSGSNRPEVLATLQQGNSDTAELDMFLTTRQGTQHAVSLRRTHFDMDGVAHVLGFYTRAGADRPSVLDIEAELDFIEKITARVPVLLFQFRLRADGTWHFPFLSRAVEQIFDEPLTEVLADKSFAFEHVHQDDKDKVWQSILASAQGLGTWRQEFRVLLRDGSCSWVFGDAVPQRASDGSVLWTGSLTDITGRKLEYDELERTRALAAEQAKKLSIAMDNTSQGILTLGSDTRIVLYNQRLLDLLDIEPAVMAGFADGHELLAYQIERGDFGVNFGWIDADSRPFIDSQPVNVGPERYLRKTRNGLTLEVKSRDLPDGGVVRTFADVTHFVEAQAALYQSEARFRSLTALSSDWFWEQDAQFRFVPAVGDQTAGRQFPVDTDFGKRRWEVDTTNLTEDQWAEHRRQLEAHETFRDFEFQRQDAKGRLHWVSISGMPIFDADGEFRGYRGVGRDITDQKRREDESQRLAFYDPLTGLPNRRLLLDRLAQALANCGRNQTQGALLFIDLDNFKDLNDTLGHDVGDQLLEKVANRLVTCVRQGDTVSRFGGDEFVVMLENLSAHMESGMEQVRTVGKKILGTLNLPFDLGSKAHYSTPSIGIALFSGQQESVDELLKRADLAMYQSKSAGRNTLRFFDPQMQATVTARAALEADLRRGLERGELVLHYQTVVNHLNTVTGVEALVRWQHPERGLVPPNEFLPIAEQTGLILPLGQWVLASACRQLVAWKAKPLTRRLSVAVNISAREFREVDFVKRVLDTVDLTGCDPNLLKLELTEALLLDNVHDAIKKMGDLRRSGVRFSLSAFGIGYSSLSYLKQLPLDELKIDQSFVRDVTHDASDAAIARTIVTLAHSLGLSVIAEGVETAGQRHFLLENGCKLFQGFSMGRPAPVADIHLDRSADGFEPTAVNSID
jgi:diguanylate cyclase (GGDEF)-like protein/PAS domain S-box-containing protein